LAVSIVSFVGTISEARKQFSRIWSGFFRFFHGLWICWSSQVRIFPVFSRALDLSAFSGLDTSGFFKGFGSVGFLRSGYFRFFQGLWICWRSQVRILPVFSRALDLSAFLG